jgi:hypothetical protein
MQLYNYKTQKYDEMETPTTDEVALDYLPQHPAAKGLFEVLRLQDLSILDAMIEVLSACVGEPSQRVKE